MKAKTSSKILSVILVLTFILASLPMIALPASAAKSGNFEYDIENGYAKITKYVGKDETEVTIPSSLGGYDVGEIGKWAFRYAMTVVEIAIPDTVIRIEDGAFYYCTSLEVVNIPGNVVSIGEHAFSRCYALPSINIPASVQYIEDWAFDACSSLTAINIAADNPYFTSVDGVLFNKGATTLIKCPAGVSDTYIIPYSVTTIAVSAFSKCRKLIGINIPVNVTEIGACAFANCVALTDIRIPSGVDEIRGYTFNYCRALKEIHIPDSVTAIDKNAFAGCTALTIYGFDTSYAKTFATEHSITFATEVPPQYTLLTDAPIIGDVNGDVKVNALDLIQMKLAFSGKATLVGFTSDMNGDGKTNAIDLIGLRKLLAA